MNQIWKSTGIMPDALEAPPFPMVAGYLWGWFKSLNSARTSNGIGMNPITYSEILAWTKLSKVIINPWEVSMIKTLDAEYMRIMSTKEAPK